MILNLLLRVKSRLSTLLDPGAFQHLLDRNERRKVALDSHIEGQMTLVYLTYSHISLLCPMSFVISLL